MDNTMLDKIITVDWNPLIYVVDIIKVPIVLVLIICVFYSFMLLLKTKILVDTVESDGNSKMKVLALLNLLVSIFLGILGTIIIVLG